MVEVSVRVHNIKLAGLGECGTDESCGHIHLNLDGQNCRKTGFYNEWIVEAAADGSADAVIATSYCVEPVLGRPLELSASLSDHDTHADRIPLVQSAVTISLTD